MILELDCGNTLIKWRLLRGREGVAASGVADDGESLLVALDAGRWRPRAIRLVSVRGEQETLSLAVQLGNAYGVAVLCATPAKELAGVRNGYMDYARLGLDRWLAVVGAYAESGVACLVLDLGTAVTSDFVAADGAHLGGYICPGLPLMRERLCSHTQRIRYDSYDAASLDLLIPGSSTAEAVERGVLLMLRSFVAGQVELARVLLGNEVAVFVTGGDAQFVRDLLPSSAAFRPDLVFAGLAMACPIE